MPLSACSHESSRTPGSTRAPVADGDLLHAASGAEGDTRTTSSLTRSAPQSVVSRETGVLGHGHIGEPALRRDVRPMRSRGLKGWTHRRPRTRRLAPPPSRTRPATGRRGGMQALRGGAGAGEGRGGGGARQADAERRRGSVDWRVESPGRGLRSTMSLRQPFAFHRDRPESQPPPPMLSTEVVHISTA